jgi:hypothetical protein
MFKDMNLLTKIAFVYLAIILFVLTIIAPWFVFWCILLITVVCSIVTVAIHFMQ